MEATDQWSSAVLPHLYDVL